MPRLKRTKARSARSTAASPRRSMWQALKPVPANDTPPSPLGFLP